jgi:hypothetical protein
MLQLVNKFWYTKEGAKAFLDQSCADLPWDLTVELDGRVLDIPEVLQPKGNNLKGEPLCDQSNWTPRDYAEDVKMFHYALALSFQSHIEFVRLRLVDKDPCWPLKWRGFLTFQPSSLTILPLETNFHSSNVHQSMCAVILIQQSVSITESARNMLKSRGSTVKSFTSLPQNGRSKLISLHLYGNDLSKLAVSSSPEVSARWGVR